MNENVDNLKIQEKGIHLNTLEKYHINQLYKQGIQLNNNCPDSHNSIFKEIHGISQ
jgi:hypothetical protein